MLGSLEKKKLKNIMKETLKKESTKELVNENKEKLVSNLQQKSKGISKGKNKSDKQKMKSYQKLKKKQSKLNEELEKLRNEQKKLVESLTEMKEENKILKDQYDKQEKLKQENDNLAKRNEQLNNDIEKFSSMKYQKAIEKFPKKIISLIHLKNQHNNIKIQNIHQLEGSMMNGDEVDAIIGNKIYTIINEIPWNQKQFKVAWRKRTNGYKPQNSWIDGKQLDQYYSQKLFEYYKKNANFFG